MSDDKEHKIMADRSDHFQNMYHDFIESFDKDPVAIQFLREDGEGGFSAGIYRMAREIERLWKKCGEPPTRDPRWQDEEDEQIDRDIDAEFAKRKANEAGGAHG